MRRGHLGSLTSASHFRFCFFSTPKREREKRLSYSTDKSRACKCLSIKGGQKEVERLGAHISGVASGGSHASVAFQKSKGETKFGIVYNCVSCDHTRTSTSGRFLCAFRPAAVFPPDYYTTTATPLSCRHHFLLLLLLRQELLS